MKDGKQDENNCKWISEKAKRDAIYKWDKVSYMDGKPRDEIIILEKVEDVCGPCNTLF